MGSPRSCGTVDPADLVAAGPRAWSPLTREHERRTTQMPRDPTARDSPWCLSEVDIFTDLTPGEMAEMARAAPERTYAAGELLHAPQEQSETLFILKRGRVRIFRLSADGRALTTAILSSPPARSSARWWWSAS